ncbi:MAG: beta-glucosidase [Frankiaceae bacterium]|nr:beta-glucosidase [Frankiaceae bacterium]
MPGHAFRDPRHRRRLAGAAVAGATALALGLMPVSPSVAATGATADPTVSPTPATLPYKNAALPVADRVRDLLSRMTLEEKVGQMTQAERGAVDSNRSLITTWKLGSLLSGGGSTPATNDPVAWADMVDAYQSQALATRLQIPLIYGVDSVHGHGNLYGATLFPHNVGMGSTRDPALVAAEEHVTAIETRATGIPWVFAPCLCVARDDRWGRTYESFGESPDLVKAMETSIDGFQGNGSTDLAHNDRVLATAKHFAGDGDTTYGSGRNSAGAFGSDYPIDQGITQVSRSHFEQIDLSPYIPAVQVHHVGSVMPSYSSLDLTNDGLGNPVKMHANKEYIQGWLKNRIGFDGFVISDYNGIHQIPPLSPNDSPTYAQVVAGVNAGIDLMMEPNDYQKFETRLIAAVNAGDVTMARINDAVSRILTKKFQLGLFEHPFADRTNIATIGSTEHRAVARQAAAESQVLLKNRDNALPISPTANVYVAGRSADNLQNQAGGWTITWQGSGNSTKGTTILQGMQQVAPGAHITYSLDASAPMTGSDVGVVVVGETSYAEGFGDVGGPQWAYDPVDNNVPREPKTMELKQQDQDTINKVCTALPKCVVLIVSGRPQIVTPQLDKIDALVASWLPGTEGEGVADVLFGRVGFTGQLSLSWPREASQEPINVGDATYNPLYPFGWGLTTSAPGNHRATEADLRLARSIVAGTKTESAATLTRLVTGVRLLVQARVPANATGVPSATSVAIANADVAALRGDRIKALRTLLGALHG